MKRLCLSVLLCFFILFGCKSVSNQTQTVKPLVIPEGYVYLGSETVFYRYYDKSPFCQMCLISEAPLTKEDVRVFLLDEPLDTSEFSLEASIPDIDSSEMPFYVYQTYQGKDWNKAAQIQIDFHQAERAMQNITSADEMYSTILEEYDAAVNNLKNSQNEFLKDYLQLKSEGSLPSLYSYCLTLFLENRQIDVSQITINIKNKEFVFPFGEFRYSPFPAEIESLVYEKGLTTIAGMSWCIGFANGDGVFPQRDDYFLMRAEEDCEITDIRLFNDDREISDIQILIMNDTRNDIDEPTDDDWENGFEIVSDFIWDNQSSITIHEDYIVGIRFDFHDPQLANKPCGYTQFDVAVEYRFGEKKGIYLHQVPMKVETISADPYEIYLWKELGIDVMAYYRDFYDALTNSGYDIVQISAEE